MPKRKSPGEGNIRQLPNGRYRGELMLGYKPDGTRNVFRCVADTKEEVRAAFRKAHDRNEKGQIITNARQTVSQFLQSWLDDVAKPGVFSRTYVGYKQLIENHAIPALGRYRLEQLEPAHIQRFYKAKLECLSPTTVHHIHACLHTAFETAVQWGLIPYSPFDRVKPPKVLKGQSTAVNPQEAATLYRTALADPLAAFWIIALTTGMRTGELYALRWTDIDLQSQRIEVQRAFSRVTGVGRLEKAPKTNKGRAVPLLNVAVDALKGHRLRQHEAKLKAGPRWRDGGYVFTTEIGTPLSEPPTRIAFHALLTKAGLPRMRLYDLRHSAASLYLALGVGPKDVSQLLGHSTINITADLYGHSFPTVLANSMQGMEKLLSGGA